MRITVRSEAFELGANSASMRLDYTEKSKDPQIVRSALIIASPSVIPYAKPAVAYSINNSAKNH